MKNTFAALFVAFAVALASSAVAADAPGPLKLPAKPGAVTFNHKTHTSGMKCTTCHATDAGGKVEGFGATVNKDKAHAACHECHKKEKKGPQKCPECHKK